MVVLVAHVHCIVHQFVGRLLASMKTIFFTVKSVIMQWSITNQDRVVVLEFCYTLTKHINGETAEHLKNG